LVDAGHLTVSNRPKKSVARTSAFLPRLIMAEENEQGLLRI
jgi:hypothetical protein